MPEQTQCPQSGMEMLSPYLPQSRLCPECPRTGLSNRWNKNPTTTSNSPGWRGNSGSLHWAFQGLSRPKLPNF